MTAWRLAGAASRSALTVMPATVVRLSVPTASTRAAISSL